MGAVAYIRKSVVHAGSRTMSWEVQEAEVRALAERYGHTDLTILSDWGRSGRLGRSGRPGYAELLDLIQDRAVEAVYAYSLSRLSRSLSEYARFAELCMQAGVPVRFAKEGEMDLSSASGRLIVSILAAVAQMEAELAQERARDMVKARRARGDKIGRPRYGEGGRPGESIEAVIQAYEEAGSMHGAARLLNDRGVPTRLGRRWWGPSVRKIVLANAPHLVPDNGKRGVKPKGKYRLARLLRCHCGTILSPHAPRGVPRYWCTRAADESSHGNPKGVAESKVWPWVLEEMSHLTVPEDLGVPLIAEQAEKWNTQLERAGRAYLAGSIDDETHDAAVKEAKDALARINAEGRVFRLGQLDWEGDPGEANEALRSLLHEIRLDRQMRPIEALWTVEAWRGP